MQALGNLSTLPSKRYYGHGPLYRTDSHLPGPVLFFVIEHGRRRILHSIDLFRSISPLILIVETLQSFGDIQPADTHLLSLRIQATRRLAAPLSTISPSVKRLCDAKAKVAATARVRRIGEGSIRGTQRLRIAHERIGAKSADSAIAVFYRRPVRRQF